MTNALRASSCLLIGIASAPPLWSACASGQRAVSLRPEHVGTPYARQTGYFKKCGLQCDDAEWTPAQIPHDALLDEVVLSSISAQETCFGVTLRADVDSDEPLTELGLRCEIDGHAQTTLVGPEQVATVDHPYSGERTVLSAGYASATRVMGLSVTQPTTETFRVVERQATVCCAMPLAQVAALTVSYADSGWPNRELSMRWSLAR
jgi:hypothetical protein